MLETADPVPIRSSALERFRSAGIRHGFFTRQGGVSKGIYEGLNAGLGSKDDPHDVQENRRRIARVMNVDADNLATLFQHHSPDVLTVKAPFGWQRPKADAMVTDRKNIVLGILTADCGPVLFADAKAGVIGAAHAGWKGALGGVLESTIAAMEDLGAARSQIIAVLGPAISAPNYEVGAEFVARFQADDSANSRYFKPSQRTGHALFDLDAYIVDRLLAMGLQASSLGRCTYAGNREFYSFRRATHRGETDYGRQISAIVLENI